MNPTLTVGARVTFTRGGSWPDWTGGVIQKVGASLVTVDWRRWDRTRKKLMAVRRHCRPDQLVLEGIPGNVDEEFPFDGLDDEDLQSQTLHRVGARIVAERRIS